mmetsp:Transcript_12317/g.21033  ORF Transcript_12317/g.21033 Transcript_12317/m.21033 type:complete len:126 (-) Transcript_12317:78-455(-)
MKIINLQILVLALSLLLTQCIAETPATELDAESLITSTVKGMLAHDFPVISEQGPSEMEASVATSTQMNNCMMCDRVEITTDCGTRVQLVFNQMGQHPCRVTSEGLCHVFPSCDQTPCHMFEYGC